MNFDFNKAEARMREICQSLKGDKVENREALEAEFANLKREYEMETAMAKAQRENKPAEKTADMKMREFLKSNEREITLGAQGAHSGAVNLTVNEIVPNLEEGNGLPSGANVVMGVTGNAVFPTDASDMELDEASEVAVLGDKTVDFDKVSVTPHRVTLSCDISNSIIDNLAFPIVAHVQKKFQKAWRKYLALKTYSQAAFSGNKGGFSGLTPAGTITLGAGTAAAAILNAVAQFTDKGFDPESLCITIDAVTEAKLKLEPKQKGVAGYVIEGGKLMGYEYTVSTKINTTLKGGTGDDKNDIVATADKYLGIGYYEFLKIQQHGEIRLGQDSTSKAMMKKNCTNLTLNTEVSFTDLSNHIYDEKGTAVKAFALYKLA